MLCLFLLLPALLRAVAQQPAAAQQTAPRRPAADDTIHSTYILGPDDQISIHVLDAEEISDKPVRIDMSGHIRLPMLGRLRAAGLTLMQLEEEIATRLTAFIKDPDVAVSILEFRSQPVSVIGSVKNPGVHQIEGRKTLIEILSLAGGLTDDAGYSVKITRRMEYGRIPLQSAVDDPTKQFSVAEVGIKGIMQASDPVENIIIQPYDVIAIPHGEMIYVTGNVGHAGGFVLHERESLSVLQALSLAGGLGHAASPQNARILRQSSPSTNRNEIAVDLKKIMAAKASDVPLRADDILFVPDSAPKKAITRAAEAAIQVGTGLAIYRP